MDETTNDRTDTKQAWDEVGAGCTDLGSKLRRHFAHVKEEDGAEAADALRKLVAAVGDAFEAVGQAARDPEVRTEARKVAGSLTEALGSTFAGVGDEVRKVFGKARGGSGPQPGASDPPSGSTWAPPRGETAANGSPDPFPAPDAATAGEPPADRPAG